MSRFSVENAFDEFREGKIDEWELKRELQREYGSCSCMNTHLDAMDLRRKLDMDKNSCDNE